MARRWHRTYGEGWYISDSSKLNAKLCPAGKYPYGEGGALIPCTRHYALYRVGTDNLIGTAKTLKDAERYL